jgi:hypothetical protein
MKHFFQTIALLFSFSTVFGQFAITSQFASTHTEENLPTISDLRVEESINSAAIIWDVAYSEAMSAYRISLQNAQGEVIYTTIETGQMAILPEIIWKNIQVGVKYHIDLIGWSTTDLSSSQILRFSKQLILKAVPECTVPESLVAVQAGSDRLSVSWKGPEQESDRIGYELQIKHEDASDWSSVKLQNDNTADIGSLLRGKYEVRIRKVCDEKKYQGELKSLWVISSVELTGIAEASTVGCGLPFTAVGVASCTENGSLRPLSSYDLDTIFGITGFDLSTLANFKAEVTQISLVQIQISGKLKNSFKGNGNVLLPFGNGLKVVVEFDSIEVDTLGRLCGCFKKFSASCFRALYDIPANYPDTIADPNQQGSNFCALPSVWDAMGNHILTGTPADPYGFGQNGLYNVVPPYPGYDSTLNMPFDTTRMYSPNGFNADGIHAITGTSFNPSGCNRDSLTADNPPQKCDPTIPPYSWMGQIAINPTAAGLAYADSMKNVIDSLVTVVLYLGCLDLRGKF